ncbi:MAG: thiolase family protein [Pseudomonadales bacterium]|nr:thiolase family protein [Pseudomonadales bacterium]
MNISQPKSYAGVALVAPTSFGYSRQSERGANWFIGRTLAQMLSTSGLKKTDVDGMAITSITLTPDSAITLTQHFGMTLRWLDQVSLGGASGIAAMQRGARAIQAGDAEVIACIGADTSIQGGFGELISQFSRFTMDASYPYGAAGPNAAFALITQRYMEQYGATREDFGHIAVSQRYNAKHYTPALLGHKPLSMGDYLTARPVAGPLHLFDCVMPCAGAEGFLLMTIERAKSLNVPYSTIAAIGELHNAFPDDPVQIRGGWAAYRDNLYNSAQVTPGDIDLLETYDDYPVISMLQFEGLGFCPEGEASQFVRATPLTFDGGGLPHNTSGGQLSVGQAGFAGGYLGLVEAIRQLNGQAVQNQVSGAMHAMVSGYGMINYDRGLCSAAAIIRGANV